jgi:hypothetical protein
VRKLVAKVAALTLAAAGTLAIAGPAAAQGHQAEHATHGTTVFVSGDGTHVTLSRSSVNEGRITFKVKSSNPTPGAGSQITLFRLVGNATLDTFKADLGDEFTSDPMTGARGTRELNRDIRAFGLADVVVGHPAMVTERLTAGRYYLMDLGTQPGPTGPAITTFTVRHSGRGLSDRQWDSRHGPVVKLTSADRFISPRTLPARGTVTVRNVADTIHFMSIGPVKKGTTDKQIQEYFDSGSQNPPPFGVDGPSVGMDVLSPGRQLQLTYNLPPGTYVLLCYIADDVTGMPHALMGMHKVVTLK